MRTHHSSLSCAVACALAFCLTACSEDPSAFGDGDSALSDLGLQCDGATGQCIAAFPGYALGWGDGSPSSVDFTVVYEPDKPREPWDLAFNPSKPTELWVVNYKDDSTITIQNPGTPEMTSVRRRDPAASHFMDGPPAIAFGVVLPNWGQSFGVCGDNDNSANGNTNFMGPTLFSADPAIFAKPTPWGLGSHLDMLHSTVFCRGIAHMGANVYWVFNSKHGSLDRYDFKKDHGPGKDDHKDGEIYRYVKGEVKGVKGMPSHLIYNPADQHLYVADTGNQRIAKLDAASGTVGQSFQGLEPVVARRYVNGAVFTEVVPPGTLEAPVGIELHEDVLYVTDTAQSRIYAFDLSGKMLNQLDTGLPAGSLAGLVVGPDGKIYFVDRISGRVYRIDPHP